MQCKDAETAALTATAVTGRSHAALRRSSESRPQMWTVMQPPPPPRGRHRRGQALPGIGGGQGSLQALPATRRPSPRRPSPARHAGRQSGATGADF